MNDPNPKDVPETAAASSGGPPKPPKETARHLEDSGGDELRLTDDERTVLERFYKKGGIESWSQYDKVVLTSALKKALTQPTAYLKTALGWIKECEPRDMSTTPNKRMHRTRR